MLHNSTQSYVSMYVLCMIIQSAYSVPSANVWRLLNLETFTVEEFIEVTSWKHSTSARSCCISFNDTNWYICSGPLIGGLGPGTKIRLGP